MGNYRRLLIYLRNYLWIYIPCIILNGCATYFVFSTTGVLLRNILRISTGEDFSIILKESSIYLGAVIVFALLSGFAPVGVEYVQEKVGIIIRKELLLGWIKTEEKITDKYHTGDIMVRMGDDLLKTLNLIGSEMNGWIFNPIVSGGISLLVVINIHWSLGLYCLAFSLINLIVAKRMVYRLRSLAESMRNQKVNLVKGITNMIAGAKEIRIFQWKYKVMRSFQQDSEVLKKYQFSYGGIYAARISFLRLIDFVNVAGLILFGFYLSKMGILSFDKIMLAVPLSDQICQMVYQLGNLWSHIMESEPSMERVFEMIDFKKEEYEGEKGNADKFFRENRSRRVSRNHVSDNDKLNAEYVLELKNVSFGYNENKRVLSDVSLQIRKGEKIAIVGESGCGKSTLLQLLLGMYQADEGEILLYGQPMKKVGKWKWRQEISCVQQTSPLLDMTIRDNILLGNDGREKREGELENIYRLTGCEKFINTLQGGDAYIAGEGGANLSGGQRQRIAIARALIRQAKILLFDEATASLDTLSQKYIDEAYRIIGKEYTTIIVSHKLSTITDSDCIYVMDRGQIVEAGTHEQLCQQKGVYWRMWETMELSLPPIHRERGSSVYVQ